MKYLVLEIQTNSDGSVGNLIDAFDSINAAQQKFYLVCASAAVSALPTHTAVLMITEGEILDRQCFKHSGGAN